MEAEDEEAARQRLRILLAKLDTACQSDEWRSVQTWAKELKTKNKVTWSIFLQQLGITPQRGLINYLSSSTSRPSKNEATQAGKFRSDILKLYSEYNANPDRIDALLTNCPTALDFADDVHDWYLSHSVPGIIKLLGINPNRILAIITSECDRAALDQSLRSAFEEKYQTKISIKYEREEYLSCALNASGHYGTGTLITGPHNSFWLLSAKHVFKSAVLTPETPDPGMITCIPQVHPLTNKYDRSRGLSVAITHSQMWHTAEDIGLAHVERRHLIPDIPANLEPLDVIPTGLQVVKDGAATRVSLGTTKVLDDGRVTVQASQVGRFAIHGDSGSLVRAVDSGRTVGVVSTIALRQAEDDDNSIEIGDAVVAVLSNELLEWLHETMEATLNDLRK